MTDLYAVLGVPRNVDAGALRSAYKKLARELHPDRNKDPAAAERFKAVTAAYDVLGDTERRKLYDEFGEASLRAGFDAAQARAFRDGRGAAGFEGFGGFGGFEDLLSGIFGGRGPARGPQRGRDLEERVEIPFLLAVRGGETPLHVRRPATCATCRGEGGLDRRACTRCGGSGRRTVARGGRQATVPCDACGGSGQAFTRPCGPCGGAGRVQEETTLQVRIPAGVEHGQALRLRGQGGSGALGGPPGDLVVQVGVAPHPRLRRDGRTLEMDLPLTLAEALAGAQVDVPTPLGGIRVRVPAGAQNGARLRVAGRGVQTAPPGDLVLVLRPTLPARPSAELLAAAAAEAQEDVRASLVL
jgi:chaperone protein DnaJ